MKKHYNYEVNMRKACGDSICSAFDEAYNSNSCDFHYLVPEELGSGKLSRICGFRGIRIIDYDINFKEDVKVVGVSKTPHVDMLFCLGDNIKWDLPEAGKEFQLLSGESYIGSSSETKKNSVYPADCNIHLVEIKMPLTQIENIIQNINSSCTLHGELEKTIKYGKYKATPSIEMIVNQMLNCPYKNTIKQIYTEGKLLELMAVYLNEVVYETEKIPNSIKLSKEDINCIHNAKALLDENLSDAPSIPILSKCIFLNEYKLKKGFKEIFGVPIHTYVINKRLELAKFLLEEKKLNVSEAATEVGYVNVSHFSVAFKKKFGINPGEYLKHINKQINL